jgi:hypothetical protein
LFEIVETPDADTADSEELDADAAMADKLGE